MSQENLTQIRSRMVQALVLMKEAIDLSLPLIKTGKNDGLKTLWEDFLREFFRYIRQKSNETRINLLSVISLHRIWR